MGDSRVVAAAEPHISEVKLGIYLAYYVQHNYVSRSYETSMVVTLIFIFSVIGHPQGREQVVVKVLTTNITHTLTTTAQVPSTYRVHELRTPIYTYLLST